jgi:hypothetical protein
MSYRHMAAALVVVASMAPALAWASGGWSWPVGSAVLLPYGSTYASAGGRSCSHGGVDIAADPGTPVRACTAGQVTFAGLVPAGEGARAFAVTVLTGDGLKVTYLPLEHADVHAGGQVSEGDAIGTLAPDGDASDAAPHLHLGVRRGESRLDPAAFLSRAAVVAPTSPKTPAFTAPAAPAVRSATPRPVVAPAPAPVVPAATVAGALRPAVPSTRGFAGTGEVVAAASAISRASGALAAVPSPRMLARPVSASPVVLGDALAAAGRARNNIAWWVLRVMIAAGALACIRPVLRASRPRVQPAPQRVRA